MGGAAYPERGADGALTDSLIGISKAHTTVMIYDVLARSTAITAR